MNHKLQVPSFTNDGAKTVGRTDTTSKITSNDAGLASPAVADCVPNEDSPRDSQFLETAGSVARNEFDDNGLSVAETSTDQEISTAVSAASVAQPSSAALESSTSFLSEPNDSADINQTPGRVGPQADADVAAAWVRGRPAPRQNQAQHQQPLRCEVGRSIGDDPTGEYAVPCGALAEAVCEYCGPMCSSCAEETFCFQGEHKLTTLPDDKPRAKHKRRGPVVEVVYIEIKCPKCKSVRLALPKKHRPKAMRKCPICKTLSRAEYLAHGFTRRRLPYHEVFETAPTPNELTVLPDGTRRLPWDTRHWADYKDE